MNMENTPLTHEESLSIIQRMISEAQGAVAKDSFDFILWGWALVAASIIHYILLVANTSIPPPSAYLLLGVCGIYAWLHHRNENKQERVKTHIDTILIYIWSAFGFALFIAMFFAGVAQVSPIPIILLIAGQATFISGGVLKFRPLVVGGVVLGFFGAIAWFLPEQWQVVMQAGAYLAGYLLPCYILIRKGKTADVQPA